MRIKFSLLIFTFLIIISCKNKEYIRTDSKKIFKLKIGYGEKDIGFIIDKNIYNKENFNFYVSNGFYYISDSKNNKIMKITNAGVPILIIFNSEFNKQIQPTVTEPDASETDDKEISYVKLYKEFPLISPGLINADNDNNIYLINKNPEYKKINPDNSIADSYVIKFNKKGKFLYKIGKSGIDTSPFTNIREMLTDNNNNLIIKEQINDGLIIYKYDNSGKLLSSNIINNSIIPLQKKEEDLIVDVIDVKLGYLEDEVYVTCQFIQKHVEKLKIINYVVIYEKIFTYSISENKIINLLLKMNPEYIDVSKLNKKGTNVEVLFGDKNKIPKPMDNIIGKDLNNNLYFNKKSLVFDDISRDMHELKIFDENRKLFSHFTYECPLDSEYSSELFLSPDGKIYSYFIKNGEVQFVINKQ